MTSRSPARPIATEVTASWWPVSGAPTGSPVTASQIRTVRSAEPDTMMSRSPARPIATASTASWWPVSGAPTGSPVTASQTRTVSSRGAGDDDVPVPGPPDGHRFHPVVVAGQRAADWVAGDRVPDPHRLIAEPDTMMSRSPARPMATAYTPDTSVAGQRDADLGRR